MNGDDRSSDLVHSELGDPELFAEVVETFLRELPERLNQLDRVLKSADFQQLAHFAHQLKGAGGGYGYPGLTQLAARIEAEARRPLPSPVVLAELVESLRHYQERMRA